jgi:hypothetical protein
MSVNKRIADWQPSPEGTAGCSHGREPVAGSMRKNSHRSLLAENNRALSILSGRFHNARGVFSPTL